MCFCSLEHSPALSAHVHWHPYCVPACEIYAINFSAVGRNLENTNYLWHQICGGVTELLWLGLSTFLFFVCCGICYALCHLFVLPFGFCIYCCLCAVTVHLSHNSRLCKNIFIITHLYKHYLLHNEPDDF
jgi:hypothetical protein